MQKVFRLNGQTFLDQIAPAFLLFPFLGKDRLLFAGCCYGKPADWGIAMQQTPDVPRIPIQLIETGCLLVIFTGLLLLQAPKVPCSCAPDLSHFLCSLPVCAGIFPWGRIARHLAGPLYIAVDFTGNYPVFLR